MVLSEERSPLMKQITADVNDEVKNYGIYIEDVRIKRADLPDANSQAIYRRMQTERQQEAAEFRGKGQEISRGIKAEAEKKVTVLLSEATRDAEINRGIGDACRNRIFATAYGLDKDFFAFYRSMMSYENSLDDETTIVLSPDSEFFKFLNNPNSSSLVTDSTEKLSENSKKLISLINNNSRLRDALCPDLSSEE